MADCEPAVASLQFVAVSYTLDEDMRIGATLNALARCGLVAVVAPVVPFVSMVYGEAAAAAAACERRIWFSVCWKLLAATAASCLYLPFMIASSISCFFLSSSSPSSYEIIKFLFVV